MTKHTNTFLSVAAVSGALAVGLGAFGAHALKSTLIENGRLDTYETAVLYHFVHTLALFGVGILQMFIASHWLNRAGWAFTFGILIFSGSLYVLCLSGITFLGAITPIGGVFFILGWLFLLPMVRNNSPKNR